MSDLELIKLARQAAHEYFDLLMARFKEPTPTEAATMDTDTAAAVSFIQVFPGGGHFEQRIIWRIAFAEQLRALGL